MFETVSELEPKVHQLSRIVNDTQEGFYLAELNSDDPEMIQGHLNHCSVNQSLKKLFDFLTYYLYFLYTAFAKRIGLSFWHNNQSNI
jgi:hypothetical protein